MNRRPQVDDIPLLATLFREALEDVAVEVDTEGSAAGIAAMQRAGAAPLRTRAAQPCRQSQLVEDARQRELLFDMGERL